MARINRNSQQDEDQTSANDLNGRENFIKRKSLAPCAPELGRRRVDSRWQNVALRPDICACGDAIVFSRLRPDYGAKEEADPPLAQRAEALPKVDPRKRPRNRAEINVCSMFWFLDFSSGPLIGQVHSIDLRRAHIETSIRTKAKAAPLARRRLDRSCLA